MMVSSLRGINQGIGSGGQLANVGYRHYQFKLATANLAVACAQYVPMSHVV